MKPGPIVAVLLAGVLGGMPRAVAYYAGGGRDAERGNDCLIGFGGIEPDQVDIGFRHTVTCQDCDASCDQDGVPAANGSCVIPIAACIDQGGVAGCEPPSALSDARAAYKLPHKTSRALPLPQSLEGSGCGAFVDLRVKLRRSHGVAKNGMASVALHAWVDKDKAAGAPGRRDFDKLRVICTPLPDGEQCHRLPPPPVARIFRFTTTEAAGECGSVRSGGPGGVVRKSLQCGGLDLGAGNSTIPEHPMLRDVRTDFGVACDASTCQVSGLTAAQTGDPATCSAEGCPFGPYVPMPNGGASVCVRNAFWAPVSGTLDTTTGSFTGGFPLSATVYLTANAALPCPLCVGGAPGVPASGTCQENWTSAAGPSPDAGEACTPVDADGDTHDCVPDPATQLTPLHLDLVPITTATAVLFAKDGVFCPQQASPGAFGSSGDYIEEVGMPAGPLTVGGPPAPARLASVFCIPSPGILLGPAANLPGPGAVSLPGTFELLP